MWVDEEIKMSDFDRLHEHLRECVDSDNDSFVGITEDGVEFHMYEFAFGLSVNAKREHDLLVEENRRLTELAAQKASRADELYEQLLWVHQRLLFDSGRYAESTQCSVVIKLLDKIKQESNDE